MEEPEELVESELVEEIILLERAPLPVRRQAPPVAQAVAVAATSFVAGAVAATALSRRRTERALLPAGGRPALPAPAADSTQTFLVHVQMLRRR